MKRRINEEEITIRDKQGGEKFFQRALDAYRKSGDVELIRTVLFLYPLAAEDCFPYVTEADESIWPAEDIIDVGQPPR